MASAAQPAEMPRSDVYIARQPIFDTQSNIYAYELLYRSSMENWYQAADADVASLSVLSNSAFVFGMDAMTGSAKAFVNFTRGALLNDYARVFPAQKLVVEVLESIEVDADVRAACIRLKNEGYTLALDDWDPNGATGSLVDLADIIKIDFMMFDRDMRRQLGEQLTKRGITLLAEKVETDDDAQQARDFGYTYVQGYFYARPEIKVGARSSGFKPHRLQLLGVLNGSDPDLDKIEELLRHDPALSFQIISYLNSASFGLRSRVTSIRQAISLLGQSGIRTWATVVILADAGSDRPNELIVTSVARGRFCELAGRAAGLGARAHDLSLLGLFSMIDAIVGRELEPTLEAVCLPADVAAAIRREPGEFSDLLSLARAYERADWPTVAQLVERVGLPLADVPSIYLDAVEWGNRTHLLG